MSITCLTCPSFMSKDESSEFFGITAAGPMCARYGWVFGSNNEAAEAALEKYSANCTSRGNTRPEAEIPSINFGTTFTPRPDLLVPTGDKVDACTKCSNFDTVTHACAAMGRMLFVERLESEADGCKWAKDDLGGVVKHNEVGPILPHLTGSTVVVRVGPKPVASPAMTPTKRRGALRWPRDYDSDAPVQEEMKDMIRAYRRVDTRKGAIYLPIFQTDYFGDRADLIPDPNASGTADPSCTSTTATFC